MEEKELKVLPNGALADPETGRIVKAPTTSLFTPETARAAVAKRYSDQKRAFADGLIQGVLEGEDFDSVEGDTRAWQEVGRRAGEVLMKSGSTRGMAELLRAIAEFTGYAPGKAEPVQPTVSVEHRIDVDQLVRLSQMLEAEQDRRQETSRTTFVQGEIIEE